MSQSQSQSMSQGRCLSQALNNLHRELTSIYSEIDSSKPAVRIKAINNFKNVLDNREDEALKLMSEDETLSWDLFYRAIHASIGMHVDVMLSSTGKVLETHTKKVVDHAMLLQKCISVANRDDQYIALDLVVSTVLDCFKEPSFVRHYGLCYLQVLKRNVLEYGNGNLALVTANKWLGE